MKNFLSDIIATFSRRWESARAKIHSDELRTKIEVFSQLPESDIILGIAQLYAQYNPNVYDKGNNGRLYTQPDEIAVAGACIALFGNNSGGTYKSNPVGLIIAQRVFDFFVENVIKYTKGEAIDTSGGMAANIMAIHIARFAFNKKVKSEGNKDLKFALITSDQSHYSLDGAVNIAGLGTNNVHYLQTDSVGAMRLDHLEETLAFYTERNYFIVVGSTLGTTVLGSMDDVNTISDICIRYDVWHHVDASWGGPIAISNYADAAVGLHKADSVTMDTHKGFKATISCGLFITKHIGLLAEANYSPDAKKYLYPNNDIDTLDNGIRGLECGKPDRTLPFGMMLLAYGISGLSKTINKDLERAQNFTSLVRNCADLTLMHEPQYLNVCIQVVSPLKEISHSEFTLMVQEYLLNQEYPKIMIELCKDSKSDTYVLRCILSNPLMDSEAMHMIIAEIIAAKKEVEKKILSKKQVH
jgi:glutamate decarboxylase